MLIQMLCARPKEAGRGVSARMDLYRELMACVLNVSSSVYDIIERKDLELFCVKRDCKN